MDWCFRFDAISSNLDLTRSSEFEPKSQKSLTKQKKMELERGKCVIASATSILKSENDDEETKGTISAIVRTV